MALKATIYKATVNVADLDRNQFLDASLTLARHPSETQERMMLRLLAWLKYADSRDGKVVFRLKDKDYTHECSVSQYGYEYGEDASTSSNCREEKSEKSDWLLDFRSFRSSTTEN